MSIHLRKLQPESTPVSLNKKKCWRSLKTIFEENEEEFELKTTK